MHPASLLLMLYYLKNPKTCPSARLFPTLNIRQVAFPARKKSQYSETPSVSPTRIRILNQIKKCSRKAQKNSKNFFFLDLASLAQGLSHTTLRFSNCPLSSKRRGMRPPAPPDLEDSSKILHVFKLKMVQLVHAQVDGGEVCNKQEKAVTRRTSVLC